MTRLLDEHVAGREDNSRQLWGLLAFTLWYERHVEQEPPLPALGAHGSAARVRVWIDMTASAHVLVFRPLIEIMRERGDEVEITARDYAQTLQLLELHGLDGRGDRAGTAVARALQKARRMTGRLSALRRWAKGRDFDVALAHGSHELTMTARRLGIPSSTTFDYEFATLQHQLGCRAATKVVVPEAIPPERPDEVRRRAAEARPVPGLKEEYYLADFEPDASLLDALRRRPRARARRAASAARRLALPPPLEPALPDDARASRPARERARVRAPAHGGAARVRARARAAVGDPPRGGASTHRASSRSPTSSSRRAGR